jgi:alpha-L-rhamnosidase
VLRRLQDESGIALVFALMTMTVMTLVAGTAIYYSTASQHESSRGKASDVAYRLLLNTEYPSWVYLVGHGATTMWERWNGDQMRGDPSMNSYNHYAYGAVADWIYRYSAGVDTWPSDAGFRTIYLHPNFSSKLGSIDFNYQSPYGEIKSAWVVRGSDVDWTVTIPANTTARLPLPASRVSAFTINGKPLADNPNLSLLSEDAATKVFKLAAGTYAIKTTSP